MGATDILTLAEAKEALQQEVSQSAHENVLAGYISAVSLAFDERFGPVVIRTVTDEAHSGGQESIWLRKAPVSQVTTFTEYSGTASTVLTAETFGTAPANGYLLDPVTGRVLRRSGGATTTFAVGDRNLRVTYQAGRYADTASVDARFKLGAQIMLAHIFRRQFAGGTVTYGDEFTGQFGTPSFSVPNAVLELLADELLPGGIA
jgi:hypothetical protein